MDVLLGVAGMIIHSWPVDHSLRLAQVRYKMMIPNGNHLKKKQIYSAGIKHG